MSSDVWKRGKPLELTCLNPFGTGQCLPTLKLPTVTCYEDSLNPFGTGQCLPTSSRREEILEAVSIPLEQGSVFRLNMDMVITSQFVSQSLWNRAVSSDLRAN